MTIFRSGLSTITLAAAGAISAAMAGEPLPPPPPPPSGDSPHLTPGTTETTFNVSVQLVQEAPDNVAPQTAVFRCAVTNPPVAAGASGDYDALGHALYYVHQITRQGDPAWADSRWSAPQRGLNGMFVKGVQFERTWGMVFDEPGTYEIISTAISPTTGLRATSAVYTYTVNNPDTVFTTAQTFVVAADGVFTGAPAAAGQYTNFDAAWTAVHASGQNRARIRVKRGTTMGGVSTNAVRTTSADFNSTYYDAWGTGANPLMNGGMNHNFFGLSASRRRAYRMRDWTWQGTWDQATNTGSAPSIQIFTDINAEWCIYNCEIRNNNGFNQTEWKGISFCNNIFDEILGNFCIGGGGTSDYAVLIGNRGYDPTDAFVMANGSQTGGFGFRMSDPVVVSQASQNDFFKIMSNNFSSMGGYPAQSPLRLVVQTSTGGAYININRNVIETGGGIGFGSGSASTPLVPTTGNIRSNIYLSSRDGACFGPTHTGWLMENCYWVKPSIRHSTWNGSGPNVSDSRFIELGNGSSVGAVGSARNNPIYIRNNAFIDLMNNAATAVFADASYSGSWTATLANNLVHAPYATSGLVSAGPFEAGSLSASPLNAGFRINVSPVQTNVEPRTVTATHYVDLSSPSGTFGEGSAGSPVTLTAPGTVTANVAQTHLIGGLRRLWLWNVTGTIANGATVTVSGGGTGTASGAMVAAGFDSTYVPVTPPLTDSGAFARLTFLGKLNTTVRRGVIMDAA